MAHTPQELGHSPEMHDAPDEWHRHTTAEDRPQAAHSEVANFRAVMASGIGAFIFVVISVVSVYLYYLSYTIDRAEDQESVGLEAEIRATRRDAMDRLERGYVWADEKRGIVLLPMDAARRSVITEYTARLERAE